MISENFTCVTLKIALFDAIILRILISLPEDVTPILVFKVRNACSKGGHSKILFGFFNYYSSPLRIGSPLGRLQLNYRCNTMFCLFDGLCRRRSVIPSEIFQKMSRSRRSRKPNNTQFFAAVAVDKNLESKLTLFDSDKKKIRSWNHFSPAFCLTGCWIEILQYGMQTKIKGKWYIFFFIPALFMLLCAFFKSFRRSHHAVRFIFYFFVPLREKSGRRAISSLFQVGLAENIYIFWERVGWGVIPSLSWKDVMFLIKERKCGEIIANEGEIYI